MAKLRWPVILFDLDGTLVDTIDLIVDSLQYTFRTELGQKLDPKVAKSWIGRPLVDMFADQSPAKIEQMVNTYITYNQEQIPRKQKSIGGMVKLVDELGELGARMGVVTSKGRKSAELSLATAGLTKRVQLVTTLESTSEHKPNPAPLLHALEQMSATVQQTVYVGDSVHDVAAGQAAGMAQIGVNWGAGSMKELVKADPTALAISVKELRCYLIDGHCG